MPDLLIRVFPAILTWTIHKNADFLMKTKKTKTGVLTLRASRSGS